jgi:hypothetical protein
MPFKSQSQRRTLYAKNPQLAEKFEAETPKGKPLPERLPKKPPKKTPPKNNRLFGNLK